MKKTIKFIVSMPILIITVIVYAVKYRSGWFGEFSEDVNLLSKE